MALFTYPPVNISTSGLATEAKQDVIISELVDISTDTSNANTTLTSINSKIVAADTTNKATETKQDVIISELQDIEADIEAGNTAQATAANQSTIISELQDIEADIEAGNTAQATSANQATIITELQDIEAAVSAGAAGQATATNQTTAINRLTQIESDLVSLNSRVAGNLVPETFDFLSLTYVTVGNGEGEIEEVVYRTGGSSGSIVATLNLSYDAQDRLASVTRT